MNNYLLVINAGSSSIKFSTYRKNVSSSEFIADAAGQVENIGNQPCFTVKDPHNVVLFERKFSTDEVHDHAAAINIIRAWLQDYFAGGILMAVGHRVVHGGQHYSAPILINAKVLNDLFKLIPLAPLHQPHSLTAICALQENIPSLPQVACFDTAFHHTQPKVAQQFALPHHFYDEGVRRYGFHGLSYEYIASTLPKIEPKLATAKVIVAHLGNGASLCALKDGKSVTTTMGFSPLDGLVMGTRCGSLDPGVLLYLMAHDGMTYQDLEQMLYHQSGLLGVSGISSDMRTLLASDDSRAQEAIELFVYRVSREIGSLTAALGGIDALVFTGGIGEHSHVIRAKVCQQAEWLGLEIDASANENGNSCISTISSKISAWVLATDENLMIARHTQHLLIRRGEEL